MLITMTNIIILITVIVSLISLTNARVFDLLKFNPYMIKHRREVWRFFTSAFVHADFIHLAVNMYVLYGFGRPTENFFIEHFSGSGFGLFFYLMMYVLAIFVSCIYSFERHKNDSWYNAVGASGAVSAVLFAFIAIAPMARLNLLFIPIPGGIPAFIIGGLYLIYSWYMGRRKIDNVGHDAHFFGAVFGFVFVFILDRSLFFHFIESIQYFISSFR